MMGSPFDGLQQGLQTAGSFIDMYNAPERERMNKLKFQAELQKSRGLDPVSQQNIAASQAGVRQRDEQLAISKKTEDRQQNKYTMEIVSAMAGTALKYLENGDKEGADGIFAAVESMTGNSVPPEARTEKFLRGVRDAAMLSNTSPIRRSEILSDGTVISITDKGRQVRDPSGKLLSGEKAAEQIRKANEYDQRLKLESARMGARGKAEEQRRQEIMSGAFKAKSTVPTIRNMLNLLETVETSGFDAAQKKFTDFFGTTPRDVGQFDALSKSLVLQNLRALGSNPTEGERAFIESTSASLSQGKEVNRAILDEMLSIAQRQIEQGRFVASGGDPSQLLNQNRAVENKNSDQPNEGDVFENPTTKEKLIYKNGEFVPL